MSDNNHDRPEEDRPEEAQSPRHAAPDIPTERLEPMHPPTVPFGSDTRTTSFGLPVQPTRTQRALLWLTAGLVVTGMVVMSRTGSMVGMIVAFVLAVPVYITALLLPDRRARRRK